MKRYRRQLKRGLRVKPHADAWKVGLESEISFLEVHDPKELKSALNHLPPGDVRRKMIVFCAKLARLRLRADTDEDAKAEYGRLVTAFVRSLR
jgi:hypothetical protein